MKTQWTLPRNEETPFNPLKEYDRLMGEKCKEAASWRTRTVISNVINLVLVIAVVWSFSQNQVVPIFVSTNDIGEVKYLGSPAKTAYSGSNVTDVMIIAHVRKFITNMYTIPQDPEVLRNNLKDCYATLTSNSASKFSRFLREDSPFDNFGLKNQTVAIETVLELSKNSYQIDFIVTTTQVDGSSKKLSRKRAILTTILLEPSKDDMLLNPIGIYITNFDVTNIGE